MPTRQKLTWSKANMNKSPNEKNPTRTRPTWAKLIKSFYKKVNKVFLMLALVRMSICPEDKCCEHYSVGIRSILLFSYVSYPPPLLSATDTVTFLILSILFLQKFQEAPFPLSCINHKKIKLFQRPIFISLSSFFLLTKNRIKKN